MSGSDCGHIFVWDRSTGAVQAMLKVGAPPWQAVYPVLLAQVAARGGRQWPGSLGCRMTAAAPGLCLHPTPSQGDTDTVNCLEPHPHHLLTVATSGIEDTIKLWTPSAEEPQVSQGGSLLPCWLAVRRSTRLACHVRPGCTRMPAPAGSPACTRAQEIGPDQERVMAANERSQGEDRRIFLTPQMLQVCRVCMLGA